MERTAQIATLAIRSRLPSVVALVVVLVAWGAVAVGRERVSRLDLSQLEPATDVCEWLNIDRYYANHFLPYIRAAVALDAVAFGPLYWAASNWAVYCRRFRIFGALVAVFWFGSAVLHGFSWIGVSIFVD